MSFFNKSSSLLFLGYSSSNSLIYGVFAKAISVEGVLLLVFNEINRLTYSSLVSVLFLNGCFPMVKSI